MNILATHHVALFTPNFDEMERFYTETLGLAVTRRWDDECIVFFDVGSTQIELIGRDVPPKPEEKILAGYFDHLALHVDDVDAAYSELEAKGVKMKAEPRDFKDVRIAFFYDPDGNQLELVQDPRLHN